jgi:hypothetical protein
MIRKLLVAGMAVSAIAIFAFGAQPAEAGNCTVVSAKARGVKQAEVSDRAAERATKQAKRWAKKGGMSVVKIGMVTTTCAARGPLTVCSSSAEACS